MDITIFGWKRNHLEKYLKDCEDISYYLSKKKNRIYTGGGGGFMLAANKGAFLADPKLSFAISVEILYKNEGEENPYYLDENLTISDTFPDRKDKLIMNKDLFIIFPGGIGTLDEFAELLTFIKTKYIKPIPIILYGKEFWYSFKKWCDSIADDYYPIDYILDIIDEVEDLKKLYKKLFEDN